MKHFSWKELNEREKKLIALGIIVTISSLIYFFIWQPLQASNHRLKNQFSQQEELLAWMKQQQTEIDRLAVSVRPVGEENRQPVFTIVENDLANAGLYTPTTQLNSANVNSITIQSDHIGFDNFMDWLTQLGNLHHITAVQGTIQRIDTEPGVAQINMTLEGF